MSSSYQQSGTVMNAIQGLAQCFPDLKANEQYHRLVNNIESCEAEIGKTRNHYNGMVKGYNSERLSIPTVFIARALGFGEAPYLQFDQSGATDPNSLKEFKTDDGERLQQLLSGAGNTIAKTIRNLTQQAGNAGKLLADKMKEAPSSAYFYMVSGGTPKGPVPLTDIHAMVASGSLPATVQISRPGSDEWQFISADPRAEVSPETTNGSSADVSA